MPFLWNVQLECQIVLLIVRKKKKEASLEEFDYRPEAECQVGTEQPGHFSKEAYTWITICFHVASKLLGYTINAHRQQENHPQKPEFKDIETL